MTKNCGLKGKMRKHQNFIWVRLTMMLMNSCGLDCTLNRCLKIHAVNILHVFRGIYCRHSPLIALWDVFFDFMSVLIPYLRFSHCCGLRPWFLSSFCAVRFRQVWSFCPYSKWPFIENVNRRIWLPMLWEREELNCSQWAEWEDLIRPWTTSHVFHLCGDDLPSDWNHPDLVPCPPLSGDSCPSDCNWLLLTSFR